MLDVEINNALDESALPAGDKLAARCAIAALGMLHCVSKTYKVPLDEVTPQHIINWCVWDWQRREVAAAMQISVDAVTGAMLDEWRSKGQQLEPVAAHTL
jgi:hypothetical protein